MTQKMGALYALKLGGAQSVRGGELPFDFRGGAESLGRFWLLITADYC